MYQYFILFYGWMIFLYIDEPILFIHLWVDGYQVISIFGLSWIMPLWTFMCKFLCGHGFIFLGYIPNIRIAGSHGNIIFILWRNCQTIFQRDCTILHSHQQCMRFYWCRIESIDQLQKEPITLQYCYNWSINTVYFYFSVFFSSQ